MPTLQRLRILMASPGDVAKERNHASALAEELNRGMAAQAGFVLDMVRWETHVSPGMGRPQQVVFDQLGPIDIFVGVMWKHFGTPSGVAGSGTEEEFNQALASFQQTGRPRMLCYFSRAPIEPPATVEAAEQLLKVVQFPGPRGRCRSEGELHNRDRVQRKAARAPSASLGDGVRGANAAFGPESAGSPGSGKGPVPGARRGIPHAEPPVCDPQPTHRLGSPHLRPGVSRESRGTGRAATGICARPPAAVLRFRLERSQRRAGRAKMGDRRRSNDH
jgi:hypothetical protein